MADLATLQTWLTEAETAYHKVMTTGGTARLRHSTNGADKWIEYNKTSATELTAYIDRLKREIAALQSGAPKRFAAPRFGF